MLIWKLEERLKHHGVPVERVRSHLKIDVDQAQITIEPRPLYCDRGNFLVKVFPRGDLALSLDSQDGFPRYYFGVEACATEVAEWMRVRRILDPPQSITCPVCNRTSYHPMDVQEGYCGACHAFTSRPCEATPDMIDGTCPVCGWPAGDHPRVRPRPAASSGAG